MMTEVRDELRDTPTASVPIDANAAAHLAPRRLGSPIPSGMQAAAKPVS